MVKTKTMKRYSNIIIILLFISTSLAAIWIPDKPVPEKLVNDLAGMFSESEVNQLENKLVDFSNRTTTQMVVVTVPDLRGEVISLVATEIGHKWGVGSEKFDNGIVILIKPKTSSEDGEIFIATGYGLEAVIPDQLTRRIIDNEILPAFRQGNFYGGVDQAINVMMELSLGEYSAKEYEEQTQKEEKVPAIAIVILILFFLFIFRVAGRAGRMGRRSIGRGNLPFWVLMGMLMNSGSRGRGSWGNFSSGRGSFGGGGGGGFGGFGGGGFGGGGAGGRW